MSKSKEVVQMNIEVITKAIDEIYDETRKPLYLAVLGQKLRKMNFPINKLKTLIEENCTAYSLVQDPAVPQRIYIQRRDEPNIECLGSQLGLNQQEISLKDINKSILLAFCVKIDDDKRMFITNKKPFHFKADETQPEGNYVEIQKDLRFNGDNYFDIMNHYPEKAKQLEGNIFKWADDNSIHRDLLRKFIPEKNVIKQTSPLLRFISLQPPEIRGRIVMPLDIVEILIK